MTPRVAQPRTRGRPRGWVALAATAAMCASMASCSRDDDSPSSSAPRFEQSRSVSSDVLSVAMHLSSSNITVADRVTLLIEARRTDGKKLEWPEAIRDANEGDPFGQSGAVPASERQVTPAPQWTVLSVSRQVVAPGHELLTLTLEPYLPGDKVIPAMRFGQGVGAVSTDELAVKVESTRPADEAAQPASPDTAAGEPDALAALSDLGPALPPAAIRVPLWRRPLVIGIAGGAAALLVLGLGGAWAACKLLRRTPDADEAFRREMRAVRAAHAAEPDAAIEASNAALRRWLAARHICPPSETSHGVASWLLGAVRSGLLGQEAVEVAALFTAIDHFRFSPEAGSRTDIAATVVDLVARLAESAGRTIPPDETARLMGTLAQIGEEVRQMTALAERIEGVRR